MTTTPWHADYANIITLTSYMAETLCSADDIAYAVEKPWKFEELWLEAMAAQEEDA